MSGFTVTGPDVDRTLESPLVALSLAQTTAMRAAEGASFYVREHGDRVVYRVEKHADGVVLTFPGSVVDETAVVRLLDAGGFADAETEAFPVPLGPGERLVDGELRYSAAWL